LTPATSDSITVTVGAANKLAFTTQPAGATATNAFTEQPVVVIQDAGGNTVAGDSTTQVTMTKESGAGTLSGADTPTTAQNGLATFSGLTLSAAGEHKLTATANIGGTKMMIDSESFTVGAADNAAQIAFTIQPGVTSAVAGADLNAQPAVTIQKANNDKVTGAMDTITLSIKADSDPLPPAGGALSGTLAVAAVDGVTTWAGIKLDLIGAYVLKASMPLNGGTVTADANSLTVTMGAAVKVGFTTLPSNTADGGTALAQQPVVVIQDAGGNTRTDSSLEVTLSLKVPNGAAITGTNPQAASSGVATFTGIAIDKVGTYKLVATGQGLATTAESADITVSAGAASKVAFTTAPSTTADGGTALAQQPVVAIQDAGGNTVPDSSLEVTLSLKVPNGAAITGTNPQAASSGVATFVGIAIDKTGTYKLVATGQGLATTAESDDITVTVGLAAKVVFTTQPGGTMTSGTAFTQQPVVTVQDVEGNTVTTNTDNVVMSKASGPAAGALTGTLTQAASSGVATFTDLQIDVVGAYTLTATQGGLTSATSGSITIAATATPTPTTATPTPPTPTPPTPTPASIPPAPQNQYTTINQAVTMTSVASSSDYTGNLKDASEKGYGDSLGIYDTTTKQYQGGSTVTSTATNSRRNVVVTFVAKVAPLLAVVAQSNSQNLNAAQLATSIQNTAAALGLTIPTVTVATVLQPTVIPGVTSSGGGGGGSDSSTLVIILAAVGGVVGLLLIGVGVYFVTRKSGPTAGKATGEEAAGKELDSPPDAADESPTVCVDADDVAVDISGHSMEAGVGAAQLDADVEEATILAASLEADALRGLEGVAAETVIDVAQAVDPDEELEGAGVAAVVAPQILVVNAEIVDGSESTASKPSLSSSSTQPPSDDEEDDGPTDPIAPPAATDFSDDQVASSPAAVEEATTLAASLEADALRGLEATDFSDDQVASSPMDADDGGETKTAI